MAPAFFARLPYPPATVYSQAPTSPEADDLPVANAALEADASRAPGAGSPPCWHQLKDPFPAWSHWFGVALSFAGLAVLLAVPMRNPLHLAALLVYGLTLVFLYFASALAHSLHCSPRLAGRLDRLDYTAIFLVIAGTYTPLCVVTLSGPWGWWLLAAVWVTAGVGIATLYLLPTRAHWPRVLCYVLMGWVAVLAAGELVRVLPGAAVAWLIVGGVVYTVGAGVYLSGRPRLWPGRFGSHDLWHCMVLVASACHFIVILQYVARAT